MNKRITRIISLQQTTEDRRVSKILTGFMKHYYSADDKKYIRIFNSQPEDNQSSKGDT